MKIFLLNGSPRKGNTVASLEAIKTGLANISDAKITQIDVCKSKLSGCIACGYCKTHGKCFTDDDTNDIIEEVVNSDLLIVASPVYWWGITSQLKSVIDKFYSRQPELLKSKKKLGLILNGQLSADDVQYSTISKQFECMCEYLGWEYVFCKPYSSYDKDDMRNNKVALAEMEGLWKELL